MVEIVYDQIKNVFTNMAATTVARDTSFNDRKIDDNCDMRSFAAPAI